MALPPDSQDHKQKKYYKATPESRTVSSVVQCNFCQLQLTSREELRYHIQSTHNNQMPMVCPYCGKGFMSQSGLNLHIQNHEGKSFMCPICDAKFTQKGTIKGHLRRIHGSAQCPTCQSVFKVGPDYNQHILKCT